MGDDQSKGTAKVYMVLAALWTLIAIWVIWFMSRYASAQ